MAAGASPATLWVHHCSLGPKEALGSYYRSQQGRCAEVAGTSCTSRPGLPLTVRMCISFSNMEGRVTLIVRYNMLFNTHKQVKTIHHISLFTALTSSRVMSPLFAQCSWFIPYKRSWFPPLMEAWCPDDGKTHLL